MGPITGLATWYCVIHGIVSTTITQLRVHVHVHVQCTAALALALIFSGVSSPAAAEHDAPCHSISLRT